MIQLAFPNIKNSPVECFKRLFVDQISLDVFRQFLLPKVNIAFRHSGKFASRVLMSMPKASIDKNNSFILRENDIWFPWQNRAVATKPQPIPVKKGANKNFGTSIL
jgi:hypothetical protein